jgi:HTH-type transcriptional regulator/antitoxin HigA
LIDPSRAAELKELKSAAAVQKFAGSLGIAPGIVVGRLQRKGVIGYNRLNHLKRKVEFDAGGDE